MLARTRTLVHSSTSSHPHKHPTDGTDRRQGPPPCSLLGQWQGGVSPQLREERVAGGRPWLRARHRPRLLRHTTHRLTQRQSPTSWAPPSHPLTLLGPLGRPPARTPHPAQPQASHRRESGQRRREQCQSQQCPSEAVLATLWTSGPRGKVEMTFCTAGRQTCHRGQDSSPVGATVPSLGGSSAQPGGRGLGLGNEQ